MSLYYVSVSARVMNKRYSCGYELCIDNYYIECGAEYLSSYSMLCNVERARINSTNQRWNRCNRITEY